MKFKTADEVRARLTGETIGEHCTRVREAMRERLDAQNGIQLSAEAQGRATLLASEQRLHDEHTREMHAMGAILTELENSPEGREVDYRQTINTATGLPGDGISGEGLHLRPEQRMAAWAARNGRPIGDTTTSLDLGKIVRGMLVGDWRGAESEKRAMSEGTNSAGGYLVPTITSAQVIDLARAQTRVMQAGATTVPLSSAQQSVPRLTADPALSWKLENAQMSTQQLTFDRVLFVAQTLPVLVQFSRELLEDSAAELGQVVRNSIAKAIAVELDRVSLRGSGTAPEPKGILNQTGVTITDLGANGVDPTWDHLSTAVQTIRTANFEPGAAIYHPRTEGKLARQKDSQGRYLQPPSDLADLRRLTTSMVPIDLTHGTASTASEAYVGDWPNLMVGIRTELQIQTLQERFADYGQVGMIAWLRADVQLAHPAAFDVLTGVL